MSKILHRVFSFIQRKITLILFCLVAMAVVIGVFFLGQRSSAPVITTDILGEQLRQVQEMVSVEYHYTNMGKFEDQTNFYGWKVPFTTKSFIISYDGVIKAGIDMSQVKVQVNKATHTITITLPSSSIISHEMLEDSLQIFDEKNNLFNSLSIEDFTSFTRDQKKGMEQRAIENGLLESAQQRARETVQSFVSMLPGIDSYTLTIR